MIALSSNDIDRIKNESEFKKLQTQNKEYKELFELMSWVLEKYIVEGDSWDDIGIRARKIQNHELYKKYKGEK